MRKRLLLRAPLFRSRRARRPFRLFRAIRHGRPAHVRKQGARRSSAGVVVLIVLAVLAIFFLWAESRMGPIASQMAQARIHVMATEAINDAVGEELSREQIQYENLVYFEKDLTGKITALKTDMVKMNRLKANITQNLIARILNANGEEIYVPLGNIVNGELLAGRGPRLPVRIISVGTVDAQYINDFEAAGINQTRHQIWVEISVNIDALLPLNDCDTTVSTQVILAETIIVGEIPDSYAQFGDSGIFESARQYDSVIS